MPTPKQMKKLAAQVGRKPPPTPTPRPGDVMPPEYWQALLRDVPADKPSATRIRTRRLAEIRQHLLRVSCRRCGRVVEIQTTDAIGRQAVWNDVGNRMLDDTCQQRTGRYEEDGCWPSYDAP